MTIYICCTAVLSLPRFFSHAADQTDPAADFWGVALTLLLIWRASTSWWCLFTNMLTGRAFFPVRVAWKAEVVSTALLGSDSRKLLFAWWPHRDFSIRTWISGAQLSASHSLLICILSEASYFPVIHIYDLSEYMVAPFSVIFQCH